MSEAYLGEIRMFGGDYAPKGWALCDGGVLPIDKNKALFGVVGKTYGGDGKTTFALPDLRGRIPIHKNSADYVLGQKGGTETVTLTVAQIPKHTHVPQAQKAPPANTQDSPAGNVWAAPGTTQYLTITGTPPPLVKMNSKAITATGADRPHDNMMPFLALNFIIALEGDFPSPG